ncbi:alpha/beta hydrolase [Loigolactobacillus jiayinensis]|uniref:Alpha/beta hydrolase n=1 Tax=Loigolactobacillus jiayinensis TaxID=2486016 RepID=A0ABW1RF09_9LACO|nr:alpha/beta hydrolase [Loigolactobacillus jiayinensis]
MKKFWIALSAIIGVLVIGMFGAGMYFYHVAVVPGHKDFLAATPTLKTSDPLYQQKKWFLDAKKSHWYETTADGLKLDADYIPAAQKTNKTAVIAHGFMSRKEEMGAYAAMFHKMGYNVLLPDNRGHGDSQGNVIGFGWLDRKDYLQWARQVVAKNGQNSEIVMFGISMGAAGMVMASGEQQLPQIKAYAVDSPYTSVEDEITYEAKQQYNLPKYPLVPVTSLVTRIRAGYFFGEASAVKQVRKNHKPIYFVTGTADKFVPHYMTKKLYQADHSPKEMWLVPGAAHVKSFSKQPVAYQQHLKQFLTKYVK